MNPHEESMLSAGIDIGTSTTKLVISRFTLMNVAGGMHVPRIEIVDKEIVYRSPIFRTPLLSSTVIDLQSVDEIVRREYERAGVSPEEIQTGAVMITGETATKKNAEKMVHHLSDTAGEFLVATAGPELEGMIAAKGSGAYDYAKKTDRVVANVDIGGGTANIAVYHGARLAGTCTLHIGGRLIEFEQEKVKNISEPVRKLIEQEGWDLEIGDDKNNTTIRLVIDRMVEVLMRAITKSTLRNDEVLLLSNKPSWIEEIETVMISGGISECIYTLESYDGSIAEYNDIGTSLARKLSDELQAQPFEWRTPDETVRATVLGAGTETTNISGATIQVESRELPQKNLPVYEISFEESVITGVNKLKSGMAEAVTVYDPAKEGQNFVLYLTHLPYLRFQDIQWIAAELLEARKVKPEPEQPLIVVLESDHAKVLGQSLQTQEKNQSILCVDQIKVEHGDYIDIGQVRRSGVVPVVIKTLTFHS